MAVALLAGAMFLPVRGVAAQAWNYPSLQVPSVSERDYTVGLSGGSGTALLFQWREGVHDGMHLGVDAGFADRKGGASLTLFAGGTVGYDLMRATSSQPFDLLLTGGVGVALGGGSSLFRLPVGLSMGHTFDLDEGMAVTPFVHPRLSLDRCSDCRDGARSSTEVSLSFDVGGDFRVTRQLSVRAALSFTGSDAFGNDDGFAVGLNWRPVSLRR